MEECECEGLPVSVSPSPRARQFPVRVGPSASILACPKEVLSTASLQQMAASKAMGLSEQEKPALGQARPGVCSLCSSVRFSLFTDGGTRAWRGGEPCSKGQDQDLGPDVLGLTCHPPLPL